MTTSGHEGAASDPVRAAYEFAWEGFQQAEFRALDVFGAAVENLAVNAAETSESDPIASVVDGDEIITQESVTTYALVDVAVAMNGLRRAAVELQQTATITTITPVTGGTPAMEVAIENRAAVLDTSFSPPLYTGEEYTRPPVTLEMSEDGESITGMHLANPDRPETYELLLEACEDQKRYVGLLNAVGTARVARGEITV